MPGRWRVLALLFAVRTTMGFQFQVVAALAPLMRSELGINLADIGLLIGLYIRYLLPGRPPQAVADVIEAAVLNDARMSLTVGLRAALASAASSGLFDSLAHPDLVRMYGPEIPWDWKAVAGYLDGLCLEVSSGGLYKPHT